MKVVATTKWSAILFGLVTANINHKCRRIPHVCVNKFCSLHLIVYVVIICMINVNNQILNEKEIELQFLKTKKQKIKLHFHTVENK